MNYFNLLDAGQIERDLENIEKYGTTEPEEIERIEKFAQKIRKENAEKATADKVSEMLPAIQERERENAIKQVRDEYRIAEGRKLIGLSPFISETITRSEEVYPSSFIPDRPANDPVSEDVRLYFDDITERWLVRVKNGLPKLVSRFVVDGCLIIDASGPGKCRAFVVFLKGEANPLIFWGGTIEAAELRKQTQFHQKGLSYARKDLYHESFMRALAMCKVVYFLTLPTHAGWNLTPSGSQAFVYSAMMKPEFEGLFLKDKSDNEKEKRARNKIHNFFLDINLESSDREFEEIVADYHRLLPDTLPFKIGTVLSAMSRLLPFYKEARLTQDRLWIVETSDDETVRVMIAVMQNRNHQSAEALFSSERITDIEDKLRKYIDCVAMIRHSTSICSKHDFEKIIKLLFRLLQNKYEEDSVNRFVPILIMDNAGIMPEDVKLHQLSITERLKIDDIEQVQRIVGELDYCIVNRAENNPDTVKQRIKVAIVAAKEMAKTLPRRSQSSSAVMFLSTTIMLKEGEIFTDADVQDMLQWLCTEAKSRTSMSRHIAKAIGTVLSDVICSRRKSITNQYEPPFWTHDSFLVAIDDSLNVTKDDFEEILSEIQVGRNKALQYLKDEDALITNKGEEQKTWTVQTEDGKKKPRRFYSFSRDLLTPEANRIVDEAIASDLFHKLDKHVDNFFPYIRHMSLDMVAGQVISDYKHGNPFVAVTGTPGSGKSDWCMMQAIQRAKSGDFVVVLDPTNAFCRDEISGHRIPDEVIDEHFEFWDLTAQGWPVNIVDFSDCENTSQEIQQLSSMLISGMHLTGPDQKFVLVNKVAEYIENSHVNNPFELESLPFGFDQNPQEKKLGGRLSALFSTVNMQQDVSLTWADRISSNGKILVVSSGNANINAHANPFDVILDTLFSYKDTHRDDKLTIILDEFQTLNRHKGCTLESILSRGRKLNMSVFLASQDYSDAKDPIGRFYAYCGTKVFFRPLGDECVEIVSKVTHLERNVIATLPDFCCAITGFAYSEYFDQNIPLQAGMLGWTYRPPYVGNYDDDI